MAHTFEFSSETAVDVVFTCTKCGVVLGFNKAEASDPRATLVNGVWTHPENPDVWVGACND